MVREKVTVATRTLQWKCVESKVDNNRFYYGRFVLSPLMKGQADTIGITMRRALLGEIDGTCITRAKSEKIPHEYSTVVGIQESVHEILMNLKEIVLRSNLYGTWDASICVRGPRYVTAQDIISPPFVKIVDNTQYIASLTEPIDFCIGLQIERNRRRRIKTLNNFQDGNYPIDAVFMPVQNVNHSIHSYGNEKQEILFIEIWTNGSLTPQEALHEASRNLIDLFIPFLHVEEENLHLEDNTYKMTLPLFTLNDRFTKLRINKEKRTLKYIYIDQLELPPRIYNYLKSSNIHTLLDFLNKSQEDLMKIEHFRIADVKQIWDILEEHFEIDFPQNRF
uniref:DNA-directed RNA polymerase subunit alpha n=1 Tax=Taxillus matsudae TaxID=2805424 RepID=A0A8K1HKD4_9MAGN|nr:RNA polymerase alpha subunit [Taxillus matsudae]UBK11071.1 RNA polymerase alpha subunit [Taxillus matsudae]UBN07210.1 RNA polymerase alpha subunit [Taxillus matsudae]